MESPYTGPGISGSGAPTTVPRKLNLRFEGAHNLNLARCKLRNHPTQGLESQVPGRPLLEHRELQSAVPRGPLLEHRELESQAPGRPLLEHRELQSAASGRPLLEHRELESQVPGAPTT